MSYCFPFVRLVVSFSQLLLNVPFSFSDFSGRLCAIYGRFLCVCVLPGAKVLVAVDGIRNRGRGADSVDAVSWAALTSLPIHMY